LRGLRGILSVGEDQEVVEEVEHLVAGLVDGAHDGGPVFPGEPQQEGDHEVRRLANGDVGGMLGRIGIPLEIFPPSGENSPSPYH